MGAEQVPSHMPGLAHGVGYTEALCGRMSGCQGALLRHPDTGLRAARLTESPSPARGKGLACETTGFA
jgi:hypothetical protein